MFGGSIISTPYPNVLACATWFVSGQLKSISKWIDAQCRPHRTVLKTAGAIYNLIYEWYSKWYALQFTLRSLDKTLHSLFHVHSPHQPIPQDGNVKENRKCFTIESKDSISNISNMHPQLLQQTCWIRREVAKQPKFVGWVAAAVRSIIWTWSTAEIDTLPQSQNPRGNTHCRSEVADASGEMLQRVEFCIPRATDSRGEVAQL